MTAAQRGPRIGDAVLPFFGSARFTASLSLVAVGTAFSTHAIVSLIGWPGLIGVLGCIVALAALSLLAQRELIEWHGLLPLSILFFVAWCALTVFWSDYRWATLAGSAYQLAFAFIGIYIALVRDAIQIVRTVGDVLRVLLGISLGLEIFAGLLIDMPIKFLGIQGDIASGGPIQGLFGTRNQLSIVALIAFVTFLIELRTRSLRRVIAYPSIAVSVICILFAHSPVIAAVLVVVGLATVALYVLRKVPAHSRRYVQWALSASATVVIVLAYVYRVQVINLLNARADFSTRYSLWIQIWELIPVNELNGWGWVGHWPNTLYPFTVINMATNSNHTDGLNGYLDVYFQTGLVGLILFVGLLTLAFVRGWILASNKRSVVYTWVPLVMVALLVTAFFESSILVASGWLIVVICAAKSAQGLSWRRSLTPVHRPS